jgi:hypothetical protein
LRTLAAVGKTSSWRRQAVCNAQPTAMTMVTRDWFCFHWRCYVHEHEFHAMRLSQ